MKNELITFKDGTLELNVPVSWEQETVWITRNQMAELFDRDVKTIGKHINNAVNYSATKLPEHLKSGGIPPFFRVRP